MTNDIRDLAGTADPLGATYDGTGTNFSLFSEVAERVELCLFDDDGAETPRRPPRGRRRSAGTATCPASAPASATASASTARGTPTQGHRCNPAQAAARPLRQGHRRRRRLGPGVLRRTASATRRARNDADSAPHVPKSVVVNPYFDWGDDRPPDVPLARDGHLRGARQGLHRHATPTSPRSCAAPTPASPTRRPSSTCTRLGVTAVELLPVHQFVHDAHLVERGLRNYWGYNSIGFFAPHNEYAADAARPAQQVSEFKHDGADAARGRHRGDPRRRLQPHRRGQPPRARRCRSRASTTPPTTGSCPTTRATTSTTRAPATA